MVLNQRRQLKVIYSTLRIVFTTAVCIHAFRVLFFMKYEWNPLKNTVFVACTWSKITWIKISYIGECLRRNYSVFSYRYIVSCRSFLVGLINFTRSVSSSKCLSLWRQDGFKAEKGNRNHFWFWLIFMWALTNINNCHFSDSPSSTSPCLLFSASQCGFLP